jgi:type VI secretion system secreted protein Hcp
MDLMLLKPGDPGLLSDSRIDGSVVGAKNEDLSGCIELVSIHFGMKQQITCDLSNSARTSGRPMLKDITAVKYFDRTSPLLYKHCLTAQAIGAGDQTSKIFVLRNSTNGSGESVLYSIMTIELTDAIIATIEAQSHPNDMATEQFSLNFTEIKWTCTTPPNAIATGEEAFGWNVVRNRRA